MRLPPEQETIRAKCFHPRGTFVEFPEEDVETSIPARFELKIPLQSLFQSPTVADMAAEITAHQEKRLDQSQLAAILDELESLSEAEAERLVSENNSPITKQ